MSNYKSEAHASRGGKHSAMGIGCHKPKALDIGKGGTWDGQKGLSSDAKVEQPQEIPTRKHGGKVEGKHAAKRLDRPARKAGGRVHKDSGGRMTNDEYKRVTSSGGDSDEKDSDEKELKRGGRAVHADEAQDKALIKREVKPMALKRDARASGGRAKGKTNINIVLAPGAGGQQQPPQKIPVPVPVQGPPSSPPGGAPMGAGPAMGGGMPPGAGPMPQPPMGRKAGGRIPHKADGGMLKARFGANSGLGRIEKAKRQMKAD